VNNKEYIYDIETLSNYHCFVFLDFLTDEVFEFSLYGNGDNSLWQLDELIDFLAKKPTLIGYNVLKFDGQVVQFILENYRRWKYEEFTEREQIIKEIYNFVQRVIELTNNNEFPPYPEWKLYCKHIDVFTIFHFDNRAKATSLKWLQFMIDWPDLREMPIEHTSKITPNQIPSILFYCHNDVRSTKAVYNIAKGETELELYKGVNKMELREDIKREYGFYDSCLNWNDVKIGDQMNMKNYFNITGLSKKDELFDLKHKTPKRGDFTFGDCFPDYMEFKTRAFKEFVNSFRNEVVRLNDKTQQFEFTYYQTKYTVAKGGLHSNDPIRIVSPTVKETLKDADVSSMYPNALRKRKLYPLHLGPQWSEVIVSNIEKRIEAKSLYKETKEKKYQSIQEAFKLALNGGAFGKTQELTSWQYDPFVTMQVTIGCQIDLLMLIEAMEFEAIPVISANTDGIVCLFNKEQEGDYIRVCKEWEKKVGNDTLGQLEYTDYSKLIQLTVNDYLAIKPDGKTKEKGDFLIDFELHKNKSFRVVPLALKEYFVNGTKPEVFLKEHISKSPTNIFDFCGAVRGRGQWYFEERKTISQQGSLFAEVNATNLEYAEEGERLQKTIRYYISNNGNKLIKCHNDGRRQELQAGPWLATVFNIYQEKKDYDINYNFYLEKIYTTLNKLDKSIHL
jgi:hypothetical protein